MEAKTETKPDKKSESSRDPRNNRDPRRKVILVDNEIKPEKKQDGTVSTSSGGKEEGKTAKEKESNSPTRKSKKSSSSKSSTSKSNSTTSKGSSKGSSKTKDGKENSKSESRKRSREAEVSLSPSPTREGRISPVPPPPSMRIPKFNKRSNGPGFLEGIDELTRKRGNKRPGSAQGGTASPPQEKKPKSLTVE